MWHLMKSCSKIDVVAVYWMSCAATSSFCMFLCVVGL